MLKTVRHLFEEPPPSAPESKQPWRVSDSIIAAALLSFVVGAGAGLWRSDTEAGLIAGSVVFALVLLVIIADGSQRRA